jgi:hypothetical protein
MVKSVEIPQGDELSLIVSLLAKDEVLSQIDFEDLPTDISIVAQGIIDGLAFDAFLRELLPNHSLDIPYEMFLGISPEVGSVAGCVLNILPPSLQKKAATFLNKRGYLALTEPRNEKMYQKLQRFLFPERDRYALINPKAAQRVILLDKQRGDNIFPATLDAQNLEAVKKWLKNSQKEWRIGKGTEKVNNTRLGLLSGFPHRSTKAFNGYHEEGGALHKALLQYGVDKNLVVSLIGWASNEEQTEAVTAIQNYKDILPPELWQRIEKYSSFFGTGEFLACDQADADWRATLLLILERVSLYKW